MEEKVKERINFKTEILRLSVVGILTIGGGTIKITLDQTVRGKEVFFIAFGMLICAGLIPNLYKTYKTLNRLTK